MDDLDFTLPSLNPNYDARLAREFFQSAGCEENSAAGLTIFAENEKGKKILLQRDKLYLLLDGEVGFFVKNKLVGTAREGEMFGEMAFLTHTARSASAIAKTACRYITLDDRQFESALSKHTEFVLTLLIILLGRIRSMVARLKNERVLTSSGEMKETSVFNKKTLSHIQQIIGEGSCISYEKNKIIMQEGRTSIFMYVVLQGRVSLAIQNRVVEKIGAGGIFGELDLIEGSNRLASAFAESDCSLLAINRETFLSLVKNNPEFAVTLLGAVAERVRLLAARHSL